MPDALPAPRDVSGYCIPLSPGADAIDKSLASRTHVASSTPRLIYCSSSSINIKSIEKQIEAFPSNMSVFISACKPWVIVLSNILLFTSYFSYALTSVQRISQHFTSISQSYHSFIPRRWNSHLFTINTSATSLITNSAVEPTTDWELDCYSRPVMIDGKKLWEVLITDSSGSFRLCETLPSSKYVTFIKY